MLVASEDNCKNNNNNSNSENVIMNNANLQKIYNILVGFRRNFVLSKNIILEHVDFID